MDRLRQDLRYALRQMRRSPGFAAVAIGTVTLGIGATTAVFSVVEGVLLRPLPYPEPHEVVRLFQINPTDPTGGPGGALARANFSHPNFVDLRERNRTLEGMAEYAVGVAPVAAGVESERVGYATVSGDFFDVLGVHPVRGRGFLAEERNGHGARVAIVSHRYWQRALGASGDLAATTLRTLDGVHTVVGVLPPGFDFQDGTDVFVPQTLGPDPSRTAHNWRALGRLRDGATIEGARRDLSAIARRLKAEHGDDTWMIDADLVPLREDLVGDLRPALLILLGAAAFLLLIACANVANLLLSRMAARQREVAVRRALGAGAGRLARQFLTETLVLALGGGALGVLLAYRGVDALLTLDPGRLPRAGGIGVNGTVLAFALAASVLTALTIGLIAALWSARGDVRDALSASQRTQAGTAAANRVRGTLVVAQVALTLVLLAGAGLLGRSFQRLLAVDPGYRTEGAVVIDLSLPYVESDAEAARLARFYDDLLLRLRSVPGIEAVAGVNAFPLSGDGANGTFLVVDRPLEVRDFEDWRSLARDPSRTGYAEYRIAHAEYFRAMDIPIVRGRAFDERDGPAAPHVALISQSLARAKWPDEDPLGKLIQFGNMDGDLRVMTVVGIVGDIHERSLAGEARPTLYGNARQRTGALGGQFSVVARGPARPAAAIAAARRIVRDLDPAALVRFRTLEDIFSASLADRRFSLLLLGIFGLTALMVAASGVYGLISFLAAQRTQEVGIRMALGARVRDILELVVGQAALLAGIGIACGLLAAFGLTRFLSGMLYEVAPADPATFVGTALLLAAVALLASYVPARRAARVDPMEALRNE